MSLCKQYPAGTTILAPSMYHTLLRKDLLAGNKGFIGLHLYSLNTFLSLQKSVEENPYEVIFSCYKILQEHISGFPIFHNISSTYDFIQQCTSFLRELLFYDIHIEALPKNNPTQEELQQILSYLYPVLQNSYELKDQLATLKTKDLSSLVIYDPSPNFHDELLYRQLEELGASRIVLETKVIKKEFYHAVNKRKEIEACAQYIIQHHLDANDIHLYVCDSSYKALIAQIFSRYEIPFTNLAESHTNIITKRFSHLLKYVSQPSLSVLLQILDTNTLSLTYPQEFIEYVHIFEKQLEDSFDHISQIQSGGELIDEREIEQLRQLEERASQTRIEILEQLHPLQEFTSIQDLFQAVNEIVIRSMRHPDQQQKDAFRAMQQQLVDISPFLLSLKDLPFVLDILVQSKSVVKENTYEGCLIADLKHTLPPVAHTFILGATQKNYPAFSPLSGIFDEAYVKFMEYPSLPTRYDFHMACLRTKLDASPHVVVSYPLGTYEGKGNEAALEMEEYLGISSCPYPLVENYQPIETTFSIDASTAHSLYLKDQVLYGSISAFERYVKCPLSYFLRYGLGLREPIDRQFSPSRIGTLSHLVLEEFVLAYGKEYAQATKDEILTILNREMKAMANVYPSFDRQLELCKQRLLHNIENTLLRLQEMEEHSALTPSKCEYSFQYTLEILGDVRMILNGFIDRMDESSGFVRILDYKSSIKSLQEKEVFAALQLQLITYSFIAEHDLHKKVLGAYYYSLKNENTMCSAGKLKRRPVEYIPFEKGDYELEQKAVHRLRGWSMDVNVDLLDDDGSHILGVSQNKDGVIKARKSYNLDVVKEHFYTMYERIGSSILSGNIKADPVEEACMFCKYHAICRFKGYYREHTPMVEVDDQIYLGGEE